MRIKTFNDLKSFVNRLNDEQLKQEFILSDEDGRIHDLDLDVATARYYWLSDCREDGIATASELKEANVDVEDAEVACEQGYVFANFSQN